MSSNRIRLFSRSCRFLPLHLRLRLSLSHSLSISLYLSLSLSLSIFLSLSFFLSLSLSLFLSLSLSLSPSLSIFFLSLEISHPFRCHCWGLFYAENTKGENQIRLPIIQILQEMKKTVEVKRV